MTHSILEVLATKPDGNPGTPLTPDELGPYLAKHYGEGDAKRRERHRLRDELYRDGGCDFMKSVIDEVFVDEDVKRLRKHWVPHARFSNVLKQLIGETSTVYSEPATRKVGGSEANQAQYQAHVEALMLDEVLDYANRMLNLHRAVLIGPRVRRDLDGNGTLVIDVVTPANVIAVTHPNDNTLVVAWLFRQDFRSARSDWQRVPYWQLWSDHEVMYLDKAFVPLTETYIEHGLGLNPWLALTYHAEAVPGFWPGEDGADLVAAQVSIWMASVLLLKETKSATKVTHTSGDISLAERGTAIDSEIARNLPEGVTANTVDMSMDPAQFTQPSDHVRDRIGTSYGLSPGAMRHDMQSADAREAQLEPLRQLRRKQVKVFRRVERVLASVMARVLEVDAADVKFEVVEFAVDFGEPQVLMSNADRLRLFLDMRAAGLANTLDFIGLLNPDLKTEAQRDEAMRRNIRIETDRNALMRPLQAISGSLGADVPDAGTDNNNAPKKTGDDSEAAPALADKEAA